MQTTIKRLYDDPSCHQLKIEVPICRAKAMEAILSGFRGAPEEPIHAITHEHFVCRYVQWAG